MILRDPALRSISTNISPIFEWRNSSYKQLDDNPNEYSVSIESAYEIVNQIRKTLKPAFKLLAEKINEIEKHYLIIILLLMKLMKEIKGLSHNFFLQKKNFFDNILVSLFSYRSKNIQNILLSLRQFCFLSIV